MSIFDQIGGEPAVAAAVGIFYIKVLDDPLLSPFFEGVSMESQQAKQRNFLTMVLKGKLEGAGPYMRRSHAHLVREKGLTDVHFDAVAGHLVATLEELEVPEKLIDAIIQPVASLRDAVLDREPVAVS